MREGYFMTPRHGDEHRALVSAFQSDVGEEGYEAYLFATGQENRVVVQDVLPNSAAGAAGLQAADEIVRYDSAPVYSTADLQFRTAAGTRGELVTLDVVRGGQTITLRTPRGPLGVMLAGARRPPSTH
jgi:S1-C subfamily serine protease